MLQAHLVIENELLFTGKGHGASGIYQGELVFSTTHNGYQESITDPSYLQQMLVFSNPLMGNHGVFDNFSESDKPKASAVVLGEINDAKSGETFSTYLQKHQLGAISGVDTRKIVTTLRKKGNMNAVLTVFEVKEEKEPLAVLASTKETIFHEPEGHKDSRKAKSDIKTVVLIDYGVKKSIVKSLTRRGARVVQVPAKSSVKEILSHHPDGILLSNGPGDPAKLLFAQETIQKLLEEYEKPMFGICLGHQLLALVAGAETFALPFGHRGGNVPVKDLFTERAIVTSQNHGYAVKTSSIPAPWQPWFECLNDATNEGLRHPEKWVRSVQFHPEASPGPEDVQYLFDDFISAL